MILCEKRYRNGIEADRRCDICGYTNNRYKILSFVELKKMIKDIPRIIIIHLAIILSTMPMPTLNSRNLRRCCVSFEKLANTVSFSLLFP